MNRVVLTSMVLAGLTVLAACKQQQPPPPTAVPVNLYKATAQMVYYYDEYPSTTEALSQVSLRPQVQGYITGIFFTEGTFVNKGQKLYEIDQRLYQDNVNAAAANLKVAEGNVAQAKQDADRYEYLAKYNAIAKQVVDHAEITLANAQSQQKAAEESLKTAKTNFSYTEVVAPFSGTIGFSQVKIGDMVSVGGTVLNTISTNDPIATDFLISEKQLPHFLDLQSGRAKAPDSLFTLNLPNNARYPFMGKISVIDRAVDSATGSIRVRLQFPNPGNMLRVGMNCVVRVHNQDLTPKLVVPGKAIVEQMGEFFVFVAKDTLMAAHDSAGNDNKKDTAELKPKLRAFQKKVVTGQTIGANIVIESGIQEGDMIVVDGTQQLHEGSEITTGTGKNNKGAGNKKGDAAPAGEGHNGKSN